MLVLPLLFSIVLSLGDETVSAVNSFIDSTSQTHSEEKHKLDRGEYYMELKIHRSSSSVKVLWEYKLDTDVDPMANGACFDHSTPVSCEESNLCDFSSDGSNVTKRRISHVGGMFKVKISYVIQNNEGAKMCDGQTRFASFYPVEATTTTTRSADETTKQPLTTTKQTLTTTSTTLTTTTPTVVAPEISGAGPGRSDPGNYSGAPGDSMGSGSTATLAPPVSSPDSQTDRTTTSTSAIQQLRGASTPPDEHTVTGRTPPVTTEATRALISPLALIVVCTTVPVVVLTIVGVVTFVRWRAHRPCPENE
eukprot:GEMP01051722.1.p1 GENE.GEMP01051722.1~~GEMP01051722.1.p1  ORF type:complete len:307 (+),score=61.90 GEMP01051722.1:85-1005(+)